MSDTAIAARDVTKHYGERIALAGVSFDVPGGAIFGLLGANGAGKTTLTRLLVGSSRPTTGSLHVLGYDPSTEANRVREHVGYMPQSPALYEDLSCRQNVEFFAAARRLESPRARIDAVLELVDLRQRARSPVFSLSGGMKQRVSLACALVHRPRVLLLDEPTAGVDLSLREQFWRYFRDLAVAGATVLVSTHQMDEALLCDRVAILRDGRVVACATPEELMQNARAEVTVYRTGGGVEKHVLGNVHSDLPHVLHAYGLSSDVVGIDVRQETFDRILLRMLESPDADPES